MMDFLRTITFFTLLISYCHYHIVTAKPCDNTDRTGCGTEVTPGKCYPLIYCLPYIFLLFFTFNIAINIYSFAFIKVSKNSFEKSNNFLLLV